MNKWNNTFNFRYQEINVEVETVHCIIWPLELFLNYSNHVQSLQCSPSVLEVDVCSVLEGVICFDLCPVSFPKSLDPFFQHICLTLTPLPLPVA